MRIGIPKEPYADQPLVAGTPDTVSKLIKLGYEVVVEAAAGVGASYFDESYVEAGASIVEAPEAWGVRHRHVPGHAHGRRACVHEEGSGAHLPDESGRAPG